MKDGWQPDLSTAPQADQALPAAEQIKLRQLLHADGIALLRGFQCDAEKLSTTGVTGHGTKSTLLDARLVPVPGSAAPGRPGLVRHEVTSPADDEMAAFQRQLRKLVLYKEEHCFRKVLDALDLAATKSGHSELRSIASQARAGWQLAHMHVLGCPVDGHKLLDLLFNGILFHSNGAKASEFKRLEAEFSEARVRLWVQVAQTRAVAVVVALHHFLRDETGLGSNG